MLGLALAETVAEAAEAELRRGCPAGKVSDGRYSRATGLASRRAAAVTVALDNVAAALATLVRKLT